MDMLGLLIESAFGLEKGAGVTLLLWILLPLASAVLSRLVMFLHGRRAARRSPTFSPTLAAVMIGVLSLFLSNLWLSMSIGTVNTVYKFVSGIGLAIFLSWPILLVLGPIFTIYVAVSRKGRRFLPNYVLYLVAVASYSIEYWWLGYLFGYDGG